MPQYDYECKECKNIFEELMSTKDIRNKLDVNCPKCGSLKTVRMFPKPSMVKVGVKTGFYTKDSSGQRKFI